MTSPPDPPVPGYPQRRVLDLTAPYEPPPVVAPVAVPIVVPDVASGSPAASGALPVRSAVTDEDRRRTEDDIAADRRAERRLVAWELLALLAVVAIVLARQLWLA